MKFLTIEKLTDLSRYRSLWHCHPKRKAVFQPHRSAGRYSCFSECAQASELNKGLHYKPICQRLAVLAPNRGCQALLLVCRAGQHVVRLVGAMLMLPNCLRTEAFDWPHSLLQGSGTNNNESMSLVASGLETWALLHLELQWYLSRNQEAVMWTRAT